MKHFSIRSLFAVLVLTMVGMQANAQCVQGYFWPNAPVAAPAEGGVAATIATNTWAGDYSQITGIQAGETYVFDFDIAGWITIYDDAGFTNVLYNGANPASVTPTTTNDLYVHWSLDAACGTDAVNHLSTMECTTCPTSTAPPGCSSNEMFSQIDPTCNFSDLLISWDAVADATGYEIDLGVTPGGVEIADNFTLGNITSIPLTGISPGDVFYATIYPTNGSGIATGCMEFSITVPSELNCYCPAGSTNGCDEGVDGVNVDGTDITSATGCTEDYTDNSAIIIPMAEGVASTVSVTNGPAQYPGEDQGTVWVDWNNNFSFDDAGEQTTLTDINADATVFEGMVTPPAGTAGGTYRMRVRINWTDAPVACGNVSYGEVEDFTIEVAGGCDPSMCMMPANVSAMAVSNTRFMATWDEVPSADFYQIRYRVAGTTTWSSKGKPAPTSEIHIAMLDPQTFYEFRVRARCCDGSWTNWSPLQTVATSVCPIPTGITGTPRADGTSIEFNWTSDPSATQSQVQYRMLGTTDWLQKGTPSTTTTVVGNLMTSTTYQYRVRTLCGTGGYGFWSAVQTASTGSGPAFRIMKDGDLTINDFAPNPVSDLATINYSLLTEGSVQMTVTDILGRMVMQNTYNETFAGDYQQSVDMSSLENGYYIVTLTLEDGSFSNFKFMKR